MTVVSRLEEHPGSRWGGWLCRLPGSRHAFRTMSSVGWSGNPGSYQLVRCLVCGRVEHQFFENEELSEDEMRARAKKHREGFEALMWLMDNVEPDYAAGRGTEDGRIVDRDEPWEVPLEVRRPSD